MESVIKRIDFLIAEKTDLTNKILEVIVEKTSLSCGDEASVLRELADIDKKLESMHAYAVVICELKEIGSKLIGYENKISTDELALILESHEKDLQEKHANTDSEVKALESQRSWFRKHNLYDDSTRMNLNRKITNTKYVGQIYYQASIDIESLVDYI